MSPHQKTQSKRVVTSETSVPYVGLPILDLFGRFMLFTIIFASLMRDLALFSCAARIIWNVNLVQL